jgi:pyruvate/2-oxoglutarate dehydrogenase complex dihydrolipoamide acyltransferase (E2) component
MNSNKEIEFPKTRIATLDVLETGRKKHHMKALLEFDVTETRKAIKNYRRKTQNKLSFTAWLVKTISRTIEEFPSSHAYLNSKKQAVAFDDIDIAITVERNYEGELVPLPYVIRATNKKSIVEISSEIAEVKSQNLTQDDVVLGAKPSKFTTNLYYALPGFLRRTVWWYFLKFPKTAKKNMGSVMVTSIGMMGKINGWFVYTSIHPLSFGVGSVMKKPVVINDKIEIREMLNMTVLLDHDVMDGAPMARFISKLSKNIESCLGLVEYRE